MRLPLYLRSNPRGTQITLAKCLNCGKVKALSNPCSIDHLAALLELNHDARTAA